MKFNMEISLDADAIADGTMYLDQDQVIDLVCKIDLAQADTVFTEALIKRLVTSLKADVDVGFDAAELCFINWKKVPSATGEQS